MKIVKNTSPSRLGLFGVLSLEPGENEVDEKDLAEVARASEKAKARGGDKGICLWTHYQESGLVKMLDAPEKAKPAADQRAAAEAAKLEVKARKAKAQKEARGRRQKSAEELAKAKKESLARGKKKREEEKARLAKQDDEVLAQASAEAKDGD